MPMKNEAHFTGVPKAEEVLVCRRSNKMKRANPVKWICPYSK
jgi:hypothetical protein